MKQRLQHAFLWLAVVSGVVGCQPQAAPVPNSPPPKHDARQPVAKLLGKAVFRHDCLSKSAGIGSADVGLERLVGIVLGREFCKAQNIKVTPEEVKAFVERLQTVAQKSFARAQVERETIDKELAAADLPAEKRQVLERRRQQLATVPAAPPPFDAQQAEAELEALRKRLRETDLPYLEQVVLEGQLEVRSFALEQGSVHAGIAFGEIQGLKCDQALYERFGGKVVGVQIGMKPVEAYTKLMREYEKEGKVQFLDDGLRSAYWKRLDNWMKQPAIPAEEVDFSWPVWLSDRARNAPLK